MLTYDEIRKRMNGYLRLLIEQEDLGEGRVIDMLREQYADNPKKFHNMIANILGFSVEHNFDAAGAFPGLTSDLLFDEVFREDELTHESFPLIAKEYGRMLTTLHRLKGRRECGDFITEQTIFAAPYTPIPLQDVDNDVKEDASQERSRKQSVLPLSKAIERYIETKLSDGAWKAHSVPDHRNRLSALVEILGDKDILDIERKDMRHYRETLRKLPPHRSKSCLYKGKTIDEILAMEPERTLNVTTVNMMVEAAATMFDWCIREELMCSSSDLI